MILDACPDDAEAVSRWEASSVPKRFPPTTADPMPSESTRKVPHYAVSPAPKMKRPWATIGPIRRHPC